MTAQTLGPTLESMIYLVATSDRAVTAEVTIDGKRYTLRKWRDGTIALRPRPDWRP